MNVLVTFSSKHGATQEIASRIADRLNEDGHRAEAVPLKSIRDLASYDAYVVGSAVYFGSWQKDAIAFVRKNLDVLSARPVWIFSSGPLGTETTDARGNDVRKQAEPKQLTELVEALKPWDHRVFFGALSPEKFGLTERVIHALPAGAELLKEGDFRDWEDIEGWVDAIADELSASAVVHD